MSFVNGNAFAFAIGIIPQFKAKTICTTKGERALAMEC